MSFAELSIFNTEVCTARIVMFVAGATWLLLVPMANMGRGTYIDENALQPGQVSRFQVCYLAKNIIHLGL